MSSLAQAASAGFSFHLNPIVSLVVAVVCAIACYFIAVRKGRRGVLWTVLGFFFGIISLIVVAVLPSKVTAPSNVSTV